MNNRYLKYSLHIAGWLAFLLLPSAFSLEGSVDFHHLFDNQHELNNLFYYLLLIVFSYVNYLFIVPRFYLKKKYGTYFSIIIICFLIVIFLPEGLDAHDKPLPPKFSGQPGPPPFFLWDIRHFILLFFVSVFVSISVKTNSQLQKITNEKLQTELSFLKAQINPHFLFNTLNSIYALAIRKDDRTADTIVKLSEFMRYIIKDANSNKVSMAKEITYIRNYIDLQKSRLGKTAQIQFDVNGTIHDQQIAPLISFCFIENAFKHGVSPEEPSEIIIRIDIAENDFELYVFNKKVTRKNIENSNGVGIQNAKERLQLLYPSKHKLSVNNGDNEFYINLQIHIV